MAAGLKGFAAVFLMRARRVSAVGWTREMGLMGRMGLMGDK